MSERTPKIVATASADIGETRYATSIRTGTHALTADEPKPEGGDAGPSSFGLVLSGLGACTAITLRMYAERKEWKLTGLGVELEYYRDGKDFRIERVLHIEGT